MSSAIMAEAHWEERRELRYSLEIEIWVEVVNPESGVRQFGTVTRCVSEWGCSFVSSVGLEEDDIISITMREVSRNRHDSESPTLFQVVRANRENKGWLIGCWKLDDNGPWSYEIGRRIAHHATSGLYLRETPALRANRRSRSDRG